MPLALPGTQAVSGNPSILESAIICNIFAANLGLVSWSGRRLSTLPSSGRVSLALTSSTPLHRICLHINDLMLSVPIAREEVLELAGWPGMGWDGAVDELVLFLAGVVPERVGVSEEGGGGVLEGPAAVGAGVRGRIQPWGGEAAVGLLHGVDGIVEVFEGVVGSDEADLAIAEGPTLVKVGCDVGVVEVDEFVASRGEVVRVAARV